MVFGQKVFSDSEDFILDPDDMPPFAGFVWHFTVLPKYMFTSIQNEKYVKIKCDQRFQK